MATYSHIPLCEQKELAFSRWKLRAQATSAGSIIHWLFYSIVDAASSSPAARSKGVSRGCERPLSLDYGLWNANWQANFPNFGLMHFNEKFQIWWCVSPAPSTPLEFEHKGVRCIAHDLSRALLHVTSARNPSLIANASKYKLCW